MMKSIRETEGFFALRERSREQIRMAFDAYRSLLFKDGWRSADTDRAFDRFVERAEYHKVLFG